MESVKDKIKEIEGRIAASGANRFTETVILADAVEFNMKVEGKMNRKLLQALCGKYGVKP
jgi:lipid A disaccharide synthetase